MSVNRDRGKRHEREVAKRLGGIRMGTMGNEDVHTDGPWSIECKSRQTFVANGWMDQATRNAPKGKTPMVIVHVQGKRHDDDYVIIRLKDFQDWYGQINLPERRQ